MTTSAEALTHKPARTGTIEVPRTGGKCAVSGRPIAAGEKYFAAVRETPVGIERVDVTAECWEGFDRTNLLAFWKTVMAEAKEKKQVFVDDEVLCMLFERLAGATEPGKISFRFVLGLILMRKRLVVYESTRRDAAGEVWIVRMRGKQDLLELRDPKLDEQQMTEVSRQLGQILNEEL
ncbi:MAG TPA: hypothetical protein VFC78_01560 [Tepidisphaeraceae bacterium]|nr:hypothetical protein [Tepidisphaeraceae bacterium]